MSSLQILISASLWLALTCSPAHSSPSPSSAADPLPARYDACRPYWEDIEDAVDAWFGVYDFPYAWTAQLYSESLCDPSAVSYVGAAGIAQFMPPTWREVSQRLDLPPGSTPHDRIAIRAGAYYEARQMAVWIWDRPLYERWRLGTAGYNAGTGNILSAQQVCLDRGQPARMWDEIELCLPAVTGHHAKETRTYIRRIERNWRGMGGCKPFAAPPALQEEWGCWD